MVKIILIKSPDEWATTKQTCGDELVVYLSFSSHNIYIYSTSYIVDQICKLYLLYFLVSLQRSYQLEVPNKIQVNPRSVRLSCNAEK